MRRADCRQLISALLLTLLPVSTSLSAENCPALLDRSIPGLLDGKPRSLCEYKGRVLLVVNTASRCGFTGQYAGLEKLQETYGKRGLTVLGFPSNDFANQEPGSDREIAEFCSMTYGVKFPMFSKTSVRGAQRHPFYVDLVKATGSEPGWNFHKYLIGRDGRTVTAFSSIVSPDSKVLVREIEAALAGSSQ
ncbi:glutathione peroxidase [Methyloversatilis thermotolerans]|uniref:glutathione peroxidase n=1 Tax=Methyloversatilis thermotolerans TaxID=1346290 RepID=UPI000366E1D1|nr:glutathione peroxidase [Methyloversatilis thermotolerans]